MKKIIPIVFAALFAVSCGTARYLSQDIPDGLPESLAVSEPLVRIELIDGGNQSYYSDSLTALAASTTGYIMKELSWPSLVNSIVPVSAEEYNHLLSAAEFLALADLSRKELESFIAPKEILDFMKRNNLHQAAFIVQTGFERTSKNYSKEMGWSVVESVLLSAVTGAAVLAGVPKKNMNRFSLVVVDADMQKLLYRNTLSHMAHCFDAKNTENVLRTLLRDYNNTAKKASKR